jgi:hypothetical protein
MNIYKTLDFSNPCGLNFHQELFGNIPNSPAIPNEKSLANMLKLAFKKVDLGQEAVENSFKRSLETFFLSKHNSKLFKQIPLEKIKSIFDCVRERNLPPSIDTAATPDVILNTPPIPAANPEASTSILTATASGMSKIRMAISSSATVLMKKEVLLPLAITTGIIAIGAIAYKVLSKPAQVTTEQVKDKKPLQFIYPRTPIHPNTEARLRSIFEKI